MKYLKKFNEMILEKSLPKITIGINELLSPIKDNKIEVLDTFEVNKDTIDINADINDLYNNKSFIKSLDKMDLKKGRMIETVYNETLLDERYDLSFFFVYDKDAMELEEPNFIILQYYDKEDRDLSSIKGYRNTKESTELFRKLTDSDIELVRGKKTRVYTTSNSGNNWELKNPKMKNRKFKEELDKDDLEKLINKDKKIKVQ